MSKVAIAFLVLISIALPVFSQSAINTKQEQLFWQWFQKNENRLYNCETNQTAIFADLDKELNKIDPHLTFEFSRKENGHRDFIISAGGIQKSFPVVISLASCAPKLPRWNIVKFRPRRYPLSIVEYNGIKVSPEDVYFAVKPRGNLIAVRLFIKHYDDSATYQNIGYLFLDQARGEYDVETKVGGIDFKPLSSESNVHAQPIKELASTIDSLTKLK